MGAAKNVIIGSLKSVIYVSFTLIIPLLTFSYIRHLEIPDMGVSITLADDAYFTIIFWLTAFGVLTSGCAFFKYTAPKESVRRGLLGLIQIIVNCLYVWSYKFSGASTVIFLVEQYGIIIIDLSAVIKVYLGVYFLLICLRLFDFIDFLAHRGDIQINRQYKKVT